MKKKMKKKKKQKKCHESVLVNLPSWHLPERNEENQEMSQDSRCLDLQLELLGNCNDEQQNRWTYTVSTVVMVAVVVVVVVVFVVVVIVWAVLGGVQITPGWAVRNGCPALPCPSRYYPILSVSVDCCTDSPFHTKAKSLCN